MTSYRRHLALGLASAARAGTFTRDGLLARMAAALDESPPWLSWLADGLAQVPASVWAGLDLEELALRIEAAPVLGASPVRLRRYILRPETMRSPPLGLEHLVLPRLAGASDLAAWLELEPAELAWFTEGPARRRKAPLARQHYRWRWWGKPHGGLRLLEVPLSRLMAVQRRLHARLLAQLPVHEAAQAFVAGRGVIDHAARHAGQPVLFHFDLRDFFGSVRASRVHALFATLGYPPGVCRSFTALTTSRVPEPVLQRLVEAGLDWEHAQRLRDPHLPQGAPTSPVLANLIAFGLDLRLDGLAAVLGARYSRYADDLVLSGPAGLRDRSVAIEARVAAIAREEGFRLNHRKTRVTTRSGAQLVCGLAVNEHPNLARRDFERLRTLLHRCAVRGPASQNDEGRTDFRAHVLGQVAWLRQVNPGKAARLDGTLARIDWSR